LFYTIYPVGNGIFFAGPVFIFNIIFFQYTYKVGHGACGKAEMAVFGVRGSFRGALDYMQVAFGANAEPGMFTIMKGFGNGIEPDNMLVKMGAGFQVHHPDSNMIEGGFLSVGGEGSDKDEEGKNEFAHTVTFRRKGTIKTGKAINRETGEQ
jgi:hypothetical protein